MDKRRLEENFFRILMMLSTLIIIASLLAVISVIFLKGLPALSLSMVTSTPKGGYYLGGEGGILNAIVGSLYLALGATLLALPISLLVALSLQREYAGQRFAGAVRFSLDVLLGVPSIVIGAFGFVVMLYLGLRASLLGGIIALTVLILPIMTRAMDEVLRYVPLELKESSYTLGATRLETTLHVVVRQILPGMLTAVLLAFGRGIGDAASVLFTAGYSDHIPQSIFDSVASLPLAVFFLLGTPYPEVQQRAYASATILLLIVLSISVMSRFLTKRFMRYVVE